MEFADEGGEGATPYEVLLHAAHDGRQHQVQPPGRDRGDLAGHAAAARRAPAGASLRPGHLGAGGRRRRSRPASAAGARPGCPPERPIDAGRLAHRPVWAYRRSHAAGGWWGSSGARAGARATTAGAASPWKRSSALLPSIAPRAALLDRMLGAREPVIGVTAPPGYGKSTLLAAWAERRGARVAWVLVRPDQRRPRFAETV